MQWYQLADTAAGWKGKLIPRHCNKTSGFGKHQERLLCWYPREWDPREVGCGCSTPDELVRGMQLITGCHHRFFTGGEGPWHAGHVPRHIKYLSFKPWPASLWGHWRWMDRGPPIDTHGCFPNICFPLGCGLSCKSISISKYIHLNTFLLELISKSLVELVPVCSRGGVQQFRSRWCISDKGKFQWLYFPV